ncbi:hypothetical protein HOLleu_04554 [Holothuria leucospilota]|uniref:Uncharacterized protein n=1 Tax=Holothuria leucospilota TaxID=206669 RepID=A0A9Q1HMD0_HOLLE|nr:hypothetical protein HOLleu_04554 [Holothuria leucospilota]
MRGRGEYRCRKVIYDLPDRRSKRGKGLISAFQNAIFVVSVLTITMYINNGCARNAL